MCLRFGSLSFSGREIRLWLRSHLTPWRRWRSPICSSNSVNRRLRGTQSRTPLSSKSTLGWKWSGRYTPNSPAERKQMEKKNSHFHFAEPTAFGFKSQDKFKIIRANENLGISAPVRGGNSDKCHRYWMDSLALITSCRLNAISEGLNRWRVSEGGERAYESYCD